MTAVNDTKTVIEQLRHQVAALHSELTRYQLVIWTAGNVSARVPGQNLMVIKPSGVAYDELTVDNMVVTDLNGRLVEETTNLRRIPQHTATSTATCLRSAASYTPTRRTPPHGQPVVSPSRACSP